MQPVTDLLFFSSRVLALYRCTRNKEYKRLMCIKEVRNGELMLPHHVNSWTIPVDLGIVSRESAKIPKTGTLSPLTPSPHSFFNTEFLHKAQNKWGKNYLNIFWTRSKTLAVDV